MNEPERPHFEGSLSTVFDCMLEGAISDRQIAQLPGEALYGFIPDAGLPLGFRKQK